MEAEVKKGDLVRQVGDKFWNGVEGVYDGRELGTYGGEFDYFIVSPNQRYTDGSSAAHYAGRRAGMNIGSFELIDAPTPLTGGSSPYYSIDVNGVTIECNDLIKALQLPYADGNVLKAVWRIAIDRMGEASRARRGCTMPKRLYSSATIWSSGEGECLKPTAAYSCPRREQLAELPTCSDRAMERKYGTTQGVWRKLRAEHGIAKFRIWTSPSEKKPAPPKAPVVRLMDSFWQAPIAARDSSVAGEAASFLRMQRFPNVYNRAKVHGDAGWQVGRSVLSECDMIAKATRLGFRREEWMG